MYMVAFFLAQKEGEQPDLAASNAPANEQINGHRAPPCVHTSHHHRPLVACVLCGRSVLLGGQAGLPQRLRPPAHQRLAQLGCGVHLCEEKRGGERGVKRGLGRPPP